MRLASSAENRIKTLMVEVSSLKDAETFLSERGMLGDSADGELRIAPGKIFGLDVRLVE